MYGDGGEKATQFKLPVGSFASESKDQQRQPNGEKENIGRIRASLREDQVNNKC